jgi:hypothetical protein
MTEKLDNPWVGLAFLIIEIQMKLVCWLHIYNIEFHVQNKLTMSIVICNTKEFAIVTSRQLVGNSQVRYQIYLHL